MTEVHAIELGPLSDRMRRAVAVRQRAREEAEANARELMEQRFPGEATRAPEVRAADGPADEALTRVAEREKADILAIGSVGRSGLDALLVGNTAERVLRRSSIPVLAVKPADFERTA